MIRGVVEQSQSAEEPDARLRRLGLRPTAQRVRVLEELAREPDDVTAQELHRRLVARGDRLGLATVYRTLAALVTHGVVDVLVHRAGEVCYRLCSDGHHHHAVCTECHRVVELDGCGVGDWANRAAEALDFVPTEHRLEVHGVCAGCR